MVNKNTFCVAPWYSLNVGKASKKITPCCKVKNIAKYDYNQLEEYWISPELSKLRKDLLNGIKNENCISCWRDEEAGGESLRLIENRHLKLSPDDAPMMEQINNPKVSNIKTFELVLGNLCNLKCVMCSPNDSSQLLAEANLNQELKKTYTDVNI